MDEEQNWYTLTKLVTKVEEQLRVIFKNRWKSLYDDEWIDKNHNQVSRLIGILGQGTFKTIGTAQRKILYSGEPSQWDLSTMAKILHRVKTRSDDKENKNIQSVVEVRNILAHHHNKIINAQDFKKFWSILQPIASQLGVSQYDISEIEFSKNSSGVVEKYSELKGEANELFKNDDFDGAIKLYSKALVLPTLSPDQLGVLHSNRSICYLKIKNEKMINLALSDAKNCEKFCPNWFKSHVRIAEAQMALKNFKEALISYDKALGLEPTDQVLLEARDLCKITLVDEEIRLDLDPYANPDDRRFIKCMKDKMNMNLSDDETLKVMENFEEIAIKKGDAQSNVLLGHRYRDGVKVEQNYEMAVKFYTKASLDGNLEGLYHWALLKSKGKGCKADLSEAIRMLERVATDTKTPKLFNGDPAVGIAASQCALGRAYQYGIGVLKSPQSAVTWYSKAAENGSGVAANNLGCMYNSGSDMPSNEKLAVQYWEMASSCSIPFPRAMENLAEYYLAKGDGKKAEMYWKMTKDHGNLFTATPDDQFKLKLDQIKKVEEKIHEKNAKNENKEAEGNSSHPSLTSAEVFETIDKLKRMSIHKGPYSSVRQVSDSEEIMMAAKNGSKFASELLKAIVHSYRAHHILQNRPFDQVSETEWNDIITEFGQALRIAEYISQLPADACFQRTILRFIRKILQKNEICELDKWARFCYVSLNMSSYIEMLTFLTETIKKYPKVSRFYDLKLCIYGFLDDLKTGYNECEKYLKLFPKDVGLLYYKASVLKHLTLSFEFGKFEETIKAYEEFIIEAGPDLGLLFDRKFRCLI